MSIWRGVGHKSVIDGGGGTMIMSFLPRLSLVPCASVRGTLGRVPAAGRGEQARAGERAGEWLGALAREIPHSPVRRPGIHT